MNTKILIVEDDPITQLAFTDSITSNADCFFVKTSSRAQAFISLEKPDLIFLDLGLPDGDGLDIIQKLSAHSEMAEIPVVVVTSSTNPEQHQNALEMGARAVITKPFEAEEIRAAIAQYGL